MKNCTLLIPIAATLLVLLARPDRSCAAELQASDGAAGDEFGLSGSISGNLGLVGARGNDGHRGSGYVFRNLDTATGTVTQRVKLTASGRMVSDFLGDQRGASLSGTTGLLGARGADSGRGAAYLFRNLDTATGTVTQSARLIASDRAANDSFGNSVSLSGESSLIGAPGDDVFKGSAYLFHGLDIAVGTVTQTAKLTAFAGEQNDGFGGSVSLAESFGLIAANGADGNRGAAYLFRNLDTAIGAVTETAKLTASDRQELDDFGGSISLSGNSGLVGAGGDDSLLGAAYLFRNLDTAIGTITESAKLVASDRSINYLFGFSVSLSGNTGLIGDCYDSRDRGAVYLFADLDQAAGTIIETVKVTASASAEGVLFGGSVSLDGDRLLIGAFAGDGRVPGSGTAYTGSVSSITTLDVGSTSRAIDGISFSSREDWIIGETTDANLVTLGLGDTAEVTAAGQAIFIGKNAGSDSNTLQIDGILHSAEVYIGSLAGNADNTLQLENTAAFEATAFRLAPDNFLKIEGDFMTIDSLLTYLGSTDLQVWDGGDWQTVDNSNHANLITSSFSSGYTEIASVPEPTSLSLFAGALGAVTFFKRRRRNLRTHRQPPAP